MRLRKGPLLLATAATAVVGILIGAYHHWRGAEADRLIREARERLDAGLVEAPEIDRLQASTAVSLLERARDLGRGEPTVVGLEHRARAIVDLQRGDLVLAEGEVTAARHRLGWTADLRVLAAEIARRKTHQEEARDHLDEALALEPEHPRALLLDADLALDAGDGERAGGALDTLVELVPRAAAVHNRRGIARELVGDRAGAEASFREAIRIDRSHRDAWINLGRVLRRHGEHAEAFDAFDTAVGLQEGDPDAHLGRGLTLAARHRLDAAVADFRRAAELAPNDAEPLLALGDLQRDLGRTEEAVATYREALAREDADAASWLKLGNALVLHGEPASAARAFREAIDRAPGLAAAHNGLGAALMHAGRRAEAESALARAAELDAVDPNPLMNLALLRERAGDEPGARAAWRRALERDPASTVARSHLDRLGG